MKLSVKEIEQTLNTLSTKIDLNFKFNVMKNQKNCYHVTAYKNEKIIAENDAILYMIVDILPDDFLLSDLEKQLLNELANEWGMHLIIENHTPISSHIIEKSDFEKDQLVIEYVTESDEEFYLLSDRRNDFSIQFTKGEFNIDPYEMNQNKLDLIYFLLDNLSIKEVNENEIVVDMDELLLTVKEEIIDKKMFFMDLQEAIMNNDEDECEIILSVLDIKE